MYLVIKDTTTVIDCDNRIDVMMQNALNLGFDESQVEVLTQVEFKAREVLEPIKPIPMSEIDKLRLEQAQANNEIIQLIMMMGGL